MSHNLDVGLLWVENRVCELSQELEPPVYCMEWIKPTDVQYGQMMIAGIVPLKIWRGEEIRIVEFHRKELLEVEGDPELNRHLGERIGQTLQTAEKTFP